MQSLKPYLQPLRDVETRKKIMLNFGVLTVLFIVFYILGHFIPEGFDWTHYYGIGVLHPIWTPWTKWILVIFNNYPFIFALSVIAIGVRTYRYNHSVIPILLAFTSLPTLWVFFMGNLDGLILVGMLLMPVGIPLVTMKPQVAAFALLARKDWFIAGAVWFVITLLIYGFWPLKLMMVLQPEWRVEWVQDISVFPWGIIPALPLMWLSRGDEDLLMAAGSLATPHLFPYHFIILMPALARMNRWWMALTWLVSWTPIFLAHAYGPLGWHAANLLSIIIWLGILLNEPKLRQRALADIKLGAAFTARMGRSASGAKQKEFYKKFTDIAL